MQEQKQTRGRTNIKKGTERTKYEDKRKKKRDGNEDEQEKKKTTRRMKKKQNREQKRTGKVGYLYGHLRL